jgi:hypothetical protein
VRVIPEAVVVRHLDTVLVIILVVGLAFIPVEVVDRLATGRVHKVTFVDSVLHPQPYKLCTHCKIYVIM